MEQVYEILLAGSGGQGLGVAGVILAQSFAEEEGKNVVETESYGISRRGGHSRSEVLTSTGEINELRVTEPDILLAMSQETADFYVPKVKETGSILLDSTYVRDVPDTKARIFSLPFTEEARSLGREAIANIIALGTIAAISPLISRESLESTVKKRFGAAESEINLQALDKGYELGGKPG
ncbi:2-oxoacid:acceptor oxidoreductase family protein [Chloroflexota bacterium]